MLFPVSWWPSPAEITATNRETWIHYIKIKAQRKTLICQSTLALAIFLHASSFVCILFESVCSVLWRSLSSTYRCLSVTGWGCGFGLGSVFLTFLNALVFSGPVTAVWHMFYLELANTFWGDVFLYFFQFWPCKIVYHLYCFSLLSQLQCFVLIIFFPQTAIQCSDFDFFTLMLCS